MPALCPYCVPPLRVLITCHHMGCLPCSQPVLTSELWTHQWGHPVLPVPHDQMLSEGGVCVWKWKSLGSSTKWLQVVKKTLTKAITNLTHLHKVILWCTYTACLWAVAILINMKNNFCFAQHHKSTVPHLELAFSWWQILNHKHS